jgi:hypothetical protein
MSFFSLYMMWQIVIGGCKRGVLHPIQREVILVEIFRLCLAKPFL